MRAAALLRGEAYRRGLLAAERLPVPVISVGNVAWGGNGKTPMAEWLARLLVEEGAHRHRAPAARGGLRA